MGQPDVGEVRAARGVAWPPRCKVAPLGGIELARVLLVDDDVDVLESLEQWLGRQHEVRIARGFPEALALLSEEEPPDVLITDLDMPPYRGSDLLAIVATRWPGVCRILHTGTPDKLDGTACVHAHHVVLKTGELRVLDALIERCCQRVRFG